MGVVYNVSLRAKELINVRISRQARCGRKLLVDSQILEAKRTPQKALPVRSTTYVWLIVRGTNVEYRRNEESLVCSESHIKFIRQEVSAAIFGHRRYHIVGRKDQKRTCQNALKCCQLTTSILSHITLSSAHPRSFASSYCSDRYLFLTERWPACPSPCAWRGRGGQSTGLQYANPVLDHGVSYPHSTHRVASRPSQSSRKRHL